MAAVLLLTIVAAALVVVLDERRQQRRGVADEALAARCRDAEALLEAAAPKDACEILAAAIEEAERGPHACTPALRRALFLLGITLARLGCPKKARRRLIRALELPSHPRADDVRILCHLGALAYADRPGDAVGYYRRLLALPSVDVTTRSMAHDALACLLSTRDEHAEADHHASAALTLILMHTRPLAPPIAHDARTPYRAHASGSARRRSSTDGDLGRLHLIRAISAVTRDDPGRSEEECRRGLELLTNLETGDATSRAWRATGARLLVRLLVARRAFAEAEHVESEQVHLAERESADLFAGPDDAATS